MLFMLEINNAKEKYKHIWKTLSIGLECCRTTADRKKEIMSSHRENIEKYVGCEKNSCRRRCCMKKKQY